MAGNSIESGHDLSVSFCIEFIDDPITDLEPGEIAARGKISLGAHVERFVADLSFWNKDQYARQWASAIDSLIKGGDRSALITSMHDPSRSEFVEWWPMWKDGSDIIFRNQLLFLGNLAEPPDFENPGKHIGARRPKNEDGDQISEWRLPLTAVLSYRLTP